MSAGDNNMNLENLDKNVNQSFSIQHILYVFVELEQAVCISEYLYPTVA